MASTGTRQVAGSPACLKGCHACLRPQCPVSNNRSPSVEGLVGAKACSGWISTVPVLTTDTDLIRSDVLRFAPETRWQPSWLFLLRLLVSRSIRLTGQPAAPAGDCQ
jgi:hypothetical protein